MRILKSLGSWAAVSAGRPASTHDDRMILCLGGDDNEGHVIRYAATLARSR